MTRAMVGLFILSIVLVQIFPTQMWIPMVCLGITILANFVYVVLSIILYVRKRREIKIEICVKQQHG